MSHRPIEEQHALLDHTFDARVERDCNIDRLLACGNPGLHMHPRTAQQAHSDAVLVGDEREAYAIGGWAAAVGLTWPGHYAHPEVPEAWVESTRLWNTMLERGLAPLDSDDSVPF